ncbi:DUF1524 domain-containing protein [Curtobacterium sp. MCSS17_016]|uniref:GmrSD restriction endonuclease domain-containing protein n=1 Tax=Curtobacterium sp. MCSS17_016 TaxID=2175644 RepID=UPI000DA7DE5E|nr:DUF1524 domain-containing protein [Curtobacterium sp. MCSS17_016]WIE81006.1 DUF1524 domain-containing protein [Curtobacterium sp. MCSS17_016]
MAKKLLLAAAVILGMCFLLVHTGQWDNVVSSLSPYAKQGSDAVTKTVHSAAPELPTAEDLPKDVTEGQRKVQDALSSAGLNKTKSDARTPSSAVKVLDKLEETTTDAKGPFKRSAFGPDWDTAHAGRCDVRNTALSRNFTDVKRAGACTVTAGTLHDPYTGRTAQYTSDSPSTVTIDAVVPLQWAWENGADTWSNAKRARFAADQNNLTVTVAGGNTGKDGGGPSKWNPADRDYLCTYVTRFIYIVNDYDLTIDAYDKAVIRRDLAMC